MFNPTGKLWYEGEWISPILYHGTNDKFLKENLKEGIYSTKESATATPFIYTTPQLWFSLSTSEIMARFFKATPTLLIVHTYNSLESIAKDFKKPSAGLVIFNYLNQDNFINVKIDIPSDRYHAGTEIVEFNRKSIEQAIQKILGLKKKITIEELNPNSML